MNEFDRIATYFAPLARDLGAFSLRDDAACITPPPGVSYILTKDCMNQGVHFIGDEAPHQIAQKLLRTNLSDLAAKGAIPQGYLLGLMLPGDTTDEWFADFAAGLAEDQERYGITLWGGDTTVTKGPLSLSLTAIGMISERPLLRKGAKAGDAVYVTGTLGDAALGLDVLQRKISLPDAEPLISRYRQPEPRTSIGPALLGIASACLDISDGLLQDAGHICSNSNVGMALRAEALPLSPAANAALQQDARLLARIVTGGDDYELLFTAPRTHAESLQQLAAQNGARITAIGEVTTGNAVSFLGFDGEILPFTQAGYQHF